MFFYLTPAEQRAEQLAEDRARAAKDQDPVPWDPDIPFSPSLKLIGSTYKPSRLFKVEASMVKDPNYSPAAEMAVSPNKKWAYRERLLPAGTVLASLCGRRRGMVCFDSDILVPMLHESSMRNDRIHWRECIMSLTPLETFSLRPGIRLARGHVVIAGLGLGYQLEQVCAKKNVSEVTLVEQSQELVDWILPRINTHEKKVSLIVGDAHVIVPELHADVALIDIFYNYGGGNHDKWELCLEGKRREASRMGKPFGSGSIKKYWFWGA